MEDLTGILTRSYELMTVNGITEVLEYKQMEPVFYVSDDSEIRARLGLVSIPK
jgi:hypothetical protein